MKKFLIIIFASLTCVGCATMNKNDCRNANWRMIGLEDGSQGKEQSYISNHRKACAKYNIAPDLDAYQGGYTQGLAKFCTSSRGYALGISGSAYAGICPSELEEQFLEGYHGGRQLFDVSREIEKLGNRIIVAQKELDQLKADLQAKEQMVVSNQSSESERTALLQQIKTIQSKIDEIQKQIDDDKRNNVRQQREYKQLTELNGQYR